MALVKIDDDFTFVGTESEFRVMFGAGPTDVNMGDDAVILLVPANATFDQRLAMAQKAAEIRAAGK